MLAAAVWAPRPSAAADDEAARPSAWGSDEMAAWAELCRPETWPGELLSFEGAVPDAIGAELAACGLGFRVAGAVALLQEGMPARAAEEAERCAHELALPAWLTALTDGPGLAAGYIAAAPSPVATGPEAERYYAARLAELAQGSGGGGDPAGSLTAAEFRAWLAAAAPAPAVGALSATAVACEMLRVGVADVSANGSQPERWRAYHVAVSPALETLRTRALAALNRAAAEAARTDLRLLVTLPGLTAEQVQQARLEPFGGHQTVPVEVDSRAAGRVSVRLRLTDVGQVLGPVTGGMLQVTLPDRGRLAVPVSLGDRLAQVAGAAPSSSEGRLSVECDLGQVTSDRPSVRVRVTGPDRGALAKLTVEGADAPLVRESLYHDFRTVNTEVQGGSITVELPTALSMVRVAADVRVWPAWREELYRRELELRSTLAELGGAKDGSNQAVHNAATGIMMQVRRAVAARSTDGLREAVARTADRLRVGEAATGPRREELLRGLETWLGRVIALEMVRLESEAASRAATRMPDQVRVVSWLPLETDPAAARAPREVTVGLHVPPEPALPPTGPNTVVTLEQAQGAMDALLQDARAGQLAPAQYHAAAKAWALAAKKPEDWGNRTMVSSWLTAKHSKEPLEELARSEVAPVYEQLKQENEAWLREARGLPGELAATLPEPIRQVFRVRGELGTDMPMPPSAAVVHQTFADCLWRMTDPALDLRPRYLLTHLDKYMSFCAQRQEGLEALRRVLSEDYLPRVGRLLSARLAHTQEVERLRGLADLVGLGARFDRDLTVSEADPAVRYLLLAQAQTAEALEAVGTWEKMTQRRGQWISSLAERCMAQGRTLAARERLLRAELRLRRTEQAAELVGLVDDAVALQGALQPLVQGTQAALPGAPSATALPLDLAGARWETVAAGLESWRQTLAGELRAAAQTPQAQALASACVATTLPETLATLSRACQTAAENCDEAAAQERAIARVTAEYHELERQARSDPVLLYSAVKGKEALAALVDRSGRPTREGDGEIRRAVDEHLLPRNWQTDFDGTWQPQVQKLRAVAESFRRYEALFGRAAEIHEQYAPVVVAGRARWAEKIIPLADKCRTAGSEEALRAAIGELYAAFDSRMGYSNEQRAAVLRDRVPLPEVDAELLPAVATAAAAYCESAAPRLIAAAAVLQQAAATIQALTAEQAAGHPWRERSQLESDLAARQGEQPAQLSARCMAWLEATLRQGGLETAAETLAAARQARAEAAGALETAYAARFTPPTPETAVAAEVPRGRDEG